MVNDPTRTYSRKRCIDRHVIVVSIVKKEIDITVLIEVKTSDSADPALPIYIQVLS